MRTLEQHIERFLEFKGDRARKRYVELHRELLCDEAARVLCRRAVALLYDDVDRARCLCEALTVLSSMHGGELVAGYRDHAWGALHENSGSDYDAALRRWTAAIGHFDAAGRDDEAAITRSCSLKTLICLNRLDLFWKWESEARLAFEGRGDRLRLARLRANVATVYSMRNEWKLAAKAYESAYEDFIATGARDSDVWAVLSNLSACYVFLGDLTRAAQLLERARSASEEAGLHASVAQLEETLARIKYLQGDLASALTLARRTREYGTRHGLDHYSSSSALTEAEILHSLCLTQEAERSAVEALDGFVRLGLKKDQGEALMVLGLCARTRGCHRRALELYADATRLFDECENVANAQRATLYQATSIFESGDPTTAAALARKLLDSLKDEAASSVGLACRLLLSRILLERGELDEAKNLVASALTRAPFLDRAPLEAEALHLFARIQERSGDLRSAFDAYVRCDHCIDRMRSQLAAGELKTSFLSDKTDLYEELFGVGLRLRLKAGEIFEFVEKAKSRTLAEMLALQPRSLVANQDQESAELQDLWSRLRASVKQIEDLDVSSEPNAARRIAELRSRVAETEKATLRLIRGRRHVGDAPVSVKTMGIAREVADCLPHRTSLVEFYFARGTIFAFHISKKSCEVHALADVHRVERLHRFVRFHLRTRPAESVQDEVKGSALLEHLEELHELLWAPLRSRLNLGKIIVVPHGFLHHVPFHALFDGDEFLIDRHAITYSPSAKVLQATRTATRRNLAVGSLVIGSSDRSAPEISAEARDVAELLPDVRVFLDSQATKARLLQELPEARLVHIAAHGTFSPVDPDASTIRLGDGPLTARELQGLNLQAELVVLSGCETGRSVTKGSDEILGLTQALLQAGARSALVSLWKVDDLTTADFMRTFYLQLPRTPSRADALRNAQLLHRRLHSHPYFWAPFVLIGDPESSSQSSIATNQPWKGEKHPRPTRRVPSRAKGGSVRSGLASN